MALIFRAIPLVVNNKENKIMLKQLRLMIMFSLIVVSVGTTITGAIEASPEQILKCADAPPEVQKYCSDTTPIIVGTVTAIDYSSEESFLYMNDTGGKIIDEADYTPEMKASLAASKAECIKYAVDNGVSMDIAGCNSISLRTSDVTPPPNLGAQEVIVEKSGNRTTVITSAEQAQKAPGFEIFFSIAGLIATAFIVLKTD